MGPIAGVDLGATNLRVAVTDGGGELLASDRTSTPRTTDGPAVAQTIAETLEATADSAGVAVTALEAIGIGTIGPLDRSAGEVIHPPNLEDVERIPLLDVLIPLIGHPRIYVENDAVAGLVGERAATEDAENLIYLTISTGIGAGVIVDGHVLRGRAGNAAEVGHVVVEPNDGRPCGCGATGHWEAYCSGGGLPGFAHDLARTSDLETGLRTDADDFDAAAVFAAADDDPVATRVLEAMTRYNAIGLADLVHAYAPDRIAIGGAVALRNQARVIDPLTEAIGDHTMLAVPEITPAAHGEDAVLNGALTLAATGGL